MEIGGGKSRRLRSSLLTTTAAAAAMLTVIMCMWVGLQLGGLAKARSAIEADAGDGRCFDFLVAFGDSLTDTGNAQRIFPLQQKRAGMHPYGKTFFHRPCDRFSDGRLLIDFIAQALQLPFLDPYIRIAGSSFEHGVNLATSGATVTNVTFLVPYSLKVQIYWLRKMKAQILENLQSPVALPSLPNMESFDKALYVVWIGGNDYNAQYFLHGMSKDELMGSVDHVMTEMASNLEALYEEGARAILVVNLPPVGCTPQLLTFVKSTQMEDFDSIGCYKPFNEVLESHNALLKQLLRNLTHQHPDATFIYADYYGLSYHILQNPRSFGLFDVLHSCCGVGGTYNFDFSTQCGTDADTLDPTMPLPTTCQNSALFANWDGIHPTESLTQIVAAAFLTGKYLDPADAFQNCTFDLTHFL